MKELYHYPRYFKAFFARISCHLELFNEEVISLVFYSWSGAYHFSSDKSQNFQFAYSSHSLLAQIPFLKVLMRLIDKANLNFIEKIFTIS